MLRALLLAGASALLFGCASAPSASLRLTRLDPAASPEQRMALRQALLAQATEDGYQIQGQAVGDAQAAQYFKGLNSPEAYRSARKGRSSAKAGRLLSVLPPLVAPVAGAAIGVVLYGMSQIASAAPGQDYGSMALVGAGAGLALGLGIGIPFGALGAKKARSARERAALEFDRSLQSQLGLGPAGEAIRYEDLP